MPGSNFLLVGASSMFGDDSLIDDDDDDDDKTIAMSVSSGDGDDFSTASSPALGESSLFNNMNGLKENEQDKELNPPVLVTEVDDSRRCRGYNNSKLDQDVAVLEVERTGYPNEGGSLPESLKETYNSNLSIPMNRDGVVVAAAAAAVANKGSALVVSNQISRKKSAPRMSRALRDIADFNAPPVSNKNIKLVSARSGRSRRALCRRR